MNSLGQGYIMSLRIDPTRLRSLTVSELGNLELGVLVYIKRLGEGRYCICAANGEIMLVGTDPGVLACAAYDNDLFPVLVH